MSEKDSSKTVLAIFTYDLSNIDNITKVRFVQLLKGRNGNKGIITSFGGRFLVPGCFAVPVSKSDEIESVLKLWKISYKKEGVLQ